MDCWGKGGMIESHRGIEQNDGVKKETLNITVGGGVKTLHWGNAT